MNGPPERPSPLQNRVTPFGEIVAISERGTMMGNRGILHDAHYRVRRRWAGRAWICCLLEFQGRRGPVMEPGHYTRLFLLDEPTALAAGHRPCAYCRRAAYNAFRDAWAAGNAHRLQTLGLGATPRATEIDRVLHTERTGPGGTKRLHRAELGDLPDGTFVTPFPTERPSAGTVDEDRDGTAWIRQGPTDRPARDVPAFLIWRNRSYVWSPRGYEPAEPLPDGPVLTLTPPSIVAALAAGFTPEPPTNVPPGSSA